MANIQVKISSCSNATKVLAYIHKKTGQALGEIRKRLNCGEYVLECDYYDTVFMKVIKDMIDDLRAMDAVIVLFEDGRQITEDYFMNWIQTCEEIEQEQKELKELMLGE